MDTYQYQDKYFWMIKKYSLRRKSCFFFCHCYFPVMFSFFLGSAIFILPKWLKSCNFSHFGCMGVVKFHKILEWPKTASFNSFFRMLMVAIKILMQEWNSLSFQVGKLGFGRLYISSLFLSFILGGFIFPLFSFLFFWAALYFPSFLFFSFGRLYISSLFPFFSFGRL